MPPAGQSLGPDHLAGGVIILWLEPCLKFASFQSRFHVIDNLLLQQKIIAHGIRKLDDGLIIQSFYRILSQGGAVIHGTYGKGQIIYDVAADAESNRLNGAVQNRRLFTQLFNFL